MIIVTDLGTYSIKNDKKCLFTSRFEMWSGNNRIGEDLLEYNGSIYAMGKGSFDNEFNKARKNYMPNLLLSLDKYMGKNNKLEDIDLVLGLPLDNLGISQELKDTLSNKTFEYKLNDVEKQVSIKRVAVVGEGIGAYYTIDEHERKSSDICLIDIGGRTSNIAVFKTGKLTMKFTIPLGSINLFDSLAAYYNNLEGSNKVAEDIEELIQKKVIKDNEEVIKIKNNFLHSILNEIDRKLDRRLYIGYFSGGSSLLIKDQIEEIEDMMEIKLVDEPVFANVNGNKSLAEAMWGE